MFHEKKCPFLSNRKAKCSCSHPTRELAKNFQSTAPMPELTKWKNPQMVYGYDQSLTLRFSSDDNEMMTTHFPFVGQGTIRLETGEVRPLELPTCPSCGFQGAPV